MSDKLNYEKWNIFSALYADVYKNSTPKMKQSIWNEVENIYNKLIDKTEDEALEEETKANPQLLNE